MKRVLKRFISVLTALILTISACFVKVPTAYADEKKPVGQVTVSMEKFTLGLGYIIEPVLVPIYEGDTGATVITRMMDKNLGKGSYEYTGSIGDQSGVVGQSFYLASVKDKDHRDAKIPKYILKECDEPYGRDRQDWLGEFDYTSMSGWMYAVNNWFPNYGAGQYKLKDGDVMRWQYTVWGYGSDLGSTFMGGGDALVNPPVKDKLTTAIATVNSSEEKEKLLQNKEVKKAYDEAMKVLQDMETTEAKVKPATENLQSSIKKYEKEKINQSVSNAIKETGAYLLKTVPEAGFGTFSGEWTVLGLARGGIEVPNGYNEKYVENVKKVVAEKKGVLHKVKYTEYSRLILGLSSIGLDATDVGEYSMVAPLGDFNGVKRQGINGPIFALIALDSRGYEIPKAQEGKVQTTREMLIDYILGKEITQTSGELGGWALSGSTPDPDITAMSIQSLAPYYNTNEKVKAAVDRGLTQLSKLQLDNGAYNSWGTVNSESTAQVIVALTALGIDPLEDERFIKVNSKTGKESNLLSGIMQFYSEGGGFKHVLDMNTDAMATDQGMYALVAYERFLDGKYSLYDMQDQINYTLDDVELYDDETKQLEVKGAPGCSLGKVTWSVEDKDVATISDKGLLTSKKAGTTKVNAKIGSKTITSTVIVKKNPAKIVMEKIDALGEITLEKEEQVKEARKAYEGLEDKFKQKVTNLNILINAEKTIAAIKEENQKVVDEFVTKVNEIDLSGGFSQKVKGYVLGLKGIYDNLDKHQKALVPKTTLDKLTNSLSKIDKLEVENLISILDSIQRPATEDDLDKVTAFLAAYDAMNDSQKSKEEVKNAKAKIDKILLEIDEEKAYEQMAKELAADMKKLTTPIDRKELETAKSLVKRHKELNERAKLYFSEDKDAVANLDKIKVNIEQIATADEFDNSIRDYVVDNINSKEKLESAKAKLDTYNKLSDEVKLYVTEKEKVESLKTAISKAEENLAKAKEVDDLINALPEKITESDYEVVLSAKEKYDALTDDQKGFVENLDKLNNVLSQILKKFEKELEVNDIKSTDKVVTGKGEAGANIEIHVDGTLVGNGSVNEDGTFEVEIPELEEGKTVSIKMTKEGYETSEVTKTVVKGNDQANPGDGDQGNDNDQDQDVEDDDQNSNPDDDQDVDDDQSVDDGQNQDGNENNDNLNGNSSGSGSNVQTGDSSSVGYLAMGILAAGGLFFIRKNKDN
ncbi:Ig-like domain-containing protein [Terrisporobacter petrolearius]|uniref:Ig-like domain-containing protein n=1 Tax=Terrisporobacter petrolearius TaxID=1460447 RepID=UPI0031CCD60E